MAAPDSHPAQDQQVAPATDTLALLRSRKYVGLLLIAAVLGVPISVAAYFFLQLVGHLQTWVFTDLPAGLGFDGAPAWWPLLPLGTAGVLVALIRRYLPGDGGEKPAEGFHAAAPRPARDLAGIAAAAIASIGLGAVIGPEAPLIALGAGLAAAAVRRIRPNSPARAVAVIGASGSFAAISALLGSPLLGAFLLMEIAGVGGPMLGAILVPGLLSAGIGALIFLGLDSLTGLGTASLSIPGLPTFTRPDVAQFGWALAIGAAAPFVALAVRRLALLIQAQTDRHLFRYTPLAGLAIAALAILYFEVSGNPVSDILFSGQNEIGTVLTHASAYSVGALLLIVLCKGLGYSLALGSFRGGPIFPSMYLGAVGGIALSHLPGLPVVPAAAMGIGAMVVAMLGLPLVSVLLATVLLESDGLAVMPLVIVAVVVSYVVSAHLSRFLPATSPHTAKQAAVR